MHRIIFGYLLLVIGLSEPVSNQVQDRSYLIKNPEVMVLTLLPRQLELNEDPKVLEHPYIFGSKILFRIEAKNTSYEPLTAVIFDPYFQNRPELFQGGRFVDYRKGIDELLKAKEKDPSRIMAQGAFLQPDESKIIEYIRLDDWYGELAPGHYQLSVKHRFEPGQPWIDSSSLTFEIISKVRPNSN